MAMVGYQLSVIGYRLSVIGYRLVKKDRKDKNDKKRLM